MRNLTKLSIVLLVAVLAACGGPGPGAPGSANNTAQNKPRPTGDASAEQVAEESRGDVDCPADINTPQRPANAPVDDVVGVRPGLTYDEAQNVVLCTGDMLVATATPGK